MNRNTIVITGLGAIACNGVNVDSFWKAIISGKEGYSDSEKHADKNFPFKIFGKIKNFNPGEYLNKEEIESIDRSAQLGVAAATMAIEDSKMDLNKINKERIAVIMGTTCGANLAIEGDFDKHWFNKKVDVLKNHFSKYHHANIPNAISKKFNFNGPSYLEATACAAGNHSIGEGVDMLRLGKIDIAICGGAEALCLMPLLGFNSTRAMSKTKCSPFDKNRSGIIVSEGSGVLILETLDHAQKRNARIYAKISGWNINCDGENMTSPVLDGSRCANLIDKTLKDAHITKEEINYISLHGTGTQKNDLTEANGIKMAFGKYSNEIPSSSIKSMIGHTFGAAGALEGVVSVLSIYNDCIPPNINLVELDEDFKLNLVTELNKKCKVEHVLSLSFGFGGCNVGVIFSKFNNNLNK